jgi:hypothetical protein
MGQHIGMACGAGGIPQVLREHIGDGQVIDRVGP